MTLDYASAQEIILAAREHLEQGPWDYLVGGSESETTMRRNRLGFDRVAFRPRILVDVSSVDPSTTFLGHKLRIPVLLAPMGSLQAFHPDGGAASAQAAAEFGTVQVVSSVTEPGIEGTAAATSTPKFFQLYIHGDWEWTKGMIDRVKAAGYAALCITADTAIYSRRERPLLSRYVTMSRRGDPHDPKWSASVTWDQLDRIREYAGMPFMLKGVGTAEDAAIAVQHGVDVVWVSNHGGRQLDHGRGAIETLPEIAQAVGGRARILIDGGVQRGSDIAKALALGADAVAIGKLQGFGLAAAGAAGVVRILELLELELISALGLMGVTAVDQLTSAYVCPAEPVIWPHEMSAFPNLPTNQIR